MGSWGCGSVLSTGELVLEDASKEMAMRTAEDNVERFSADGIGGAFKFKIGTGGYVNSQRPEDEREGSSPEDSSCEVFNVEQFKKEFAKNARGGSKHASLEDVFRSDEEQKRLQESADASTSIMWSKREQVTIPKGVGKEVSMKLLLRAIMAYVQHKNEAHNRPQSKKDPGVGWMDQHGLIMEEMIEWTSAAFSDVPAKDRITKLEEMIREFAHMGEAGVHLKATVVHEYFQICQKI